VDGKKCGRRGLLWDLCWISSQLGLANLSLSALVTVSRFRNLSRDLFSARPRPPPLVECRLLLDDSPPRSVGFPQVPFFTPRHAIAAARVN